MKALACLLSAAPVLVGLGAEVVTVQGRNQVGAAGITQVGIVVRDVMRSAEVLAALVGTEMPPIHPAEPGSQAAPARFARVRLDNITIELLEPVGDGPGMYRNFLDAHGPGMHHIGLVTGGSVSLADQASGLARLGGKIVAEGDDIAFVDLGAGIRPVIEIMGPSARDRLFGPGATLMRDAGATQPGRATCVTHVGIVVRAMEQARKAYADLLGVEPLPIQQFKAATGTAQYSIFNLENISIELLQQTGDGTGAYADFLGARPQRVHHLGVHRTGADAGVGMPEQIAWLVQHGGEVAVNAGGFAYVDFRPRLGVFLEVMPEATGDRVYPHSHR